MTDIREWLNAAEKLAPPPADKNASRKDWARHYAALALAAHAAFRDQLPTIPRNPEPGSRPELGYLSLIATSSTAAAVALLVKPKVARKLWNLTPELGALNGEYVDWLAERLAELGINPVDLYPWFSPGDFEVVPRPMRAQPPCDRCAEGTHCEQCGCCEF